jgi:predicted GNAT family acetyltransferase
LHHRYVRLDDGDTEETLALVSRRPELNVILINNIRMFGMGRGDTPFHGEYFGMRDDSGLAAVGVLFNLGSIFFYAVRDEAVEGMAEYILGLGRVPSFMNGKASHLKRILEVLERKTGYTFNRKPADLMILRGPVREEVDTSCARRSLMSDLASLVEMQVALEEELFGRASMDDFSLRELLSWQVDKSAASVAECDGFVVSKAEATLLEGTGANVGGVYTRPAFRGRGFSTACVGNLCRCVLNEVPLIALTVEKENPASRRVYRKIGFEKIDDWMIVTPRPRA